MRYLLTTVILAIFINLSYAAEDSEGIQLPASVKKSMDSFDKDIIKAKHRLNKALLKEEDRATKSGKFDVVMAIRKERARIIGKSLDQPKRKIDYSKITARDWKSLKGIEVRVMATSNQLTAQNTGIMLTGAKIHIVPHPADKWSGGGSKTGVFCDASGYKSSDPWMHMQARSGVRSFPGISGVEGTGVLSLYCFDAVAVDNQGYIRVKVVQD